MSTTLHPAYHRTESLEPRAIAYVATNSRSTAPMPSTQSEKPAPFPFEKILPTLPKIPKEKGPREVTEVNPHDLDSRKIREQERINAKPNPARQVNNVARKLFGDTDSGSDT